MNGKLAWRRQWGGGGAQASRNRTGSGLVQNGAALDDSRNFTLQKLQQAMT
jgi:hypothetical protein